MCLTDFVGSLDWFRWKGKMEWKKEEERKEIQYSIEKNVFVRAKVMIKESDGMSNKNISCRNSNAGSSSNKEQRLLLYLYDVLTALRIVSLSHPQQPLHAAPDRCSGPTTQQ